MYNGKSCLYTDPIFTNPRFLWADPMPEVLLETMLHLDWQTLPPSIQDTGNFGENPYKYPATAWNPMMSYLHHVLFLLIPSSLRAGLLEKDVSAMHELSAWMFQFSTKLFFFSFFVHFLYHIWQTHFADIQLPLQGLSIVSFDLFTGIPTSYTLLASEKKK